MRAILLVLLAIGSLQTQTNRVLVIHNIQNFKVLYSKMIHVLNQRFEKVIVESTARRDFRASTFVYKKPLYDLVIVAFPHSNEAMLIAEKLELLKFYDEGKNLLFLSDSSVVQNWRVLLSQFGFDATSIEDTKDGYNGIQTSPVSRKVFLDKEKILHGKLAKGLKKGLVYEGGALALTPYENRISWSLVEAPENALFITNSGTKQVLDSNKMNLVVGAHGSTNKSRIALVGSLKMFSDQIDAESEGDNVIFFDNLLSWVGLKSQMIYVKDFVMCSARTHECKEPLSLPNQHGFYVKFKLENEDGEFYESNDNSLSILVTKQVVYMEVKPEIKGENQERYYYKEFPAITNGLYKFKIIHNKPGYYINSNENTRMLHAVTTPIDSIEFFSLEGMPFMVMIFLVMFSALNIIRLTAGKEENN